jgi:hypothetical protein
VDCPRERCSPSQSASTYPEIAATALADYLTHQEHGIEKICEMIVDDILASQAGNDREHVLTLLTCSIMFSGRTRRRDHNSILERLLVVLRNRDTLNPCSAAASSLSSETIVPSQRC